MSPVEPAPTSVLVVTSSPDRRESTVGLRLVATELASRPGVRVAVWFLRDLEDRMTWGDRSIDELRTWLLPAVLEAVRVPRLAHLVRGRRLRRWLAEVDPTVVVLDDGLGDRVIEHLPRPGATRVVRVNPEPSDDLALEPAPSQVADLVLVGPGADPGPWADATLLHEPELHDFTVAVAASAETTRTSTRRLLGVPLDRPLVVGWGTDGWVDGPDLFVRALWQLERDHCLDAHGLWLGLSDDDEERQRLVDEADRCGIGDRLHLRPGDEAPARLCGDVVFLPYRSPARRGDLLTTIGGGLVVVSFPGIGLEHASVHTVPMLDLEAAASEIARSIGGERSERASRALADFGARRWVDEVLDALERRT